MEHRMTDTQQISDFVLAGNAVFTIRSATSGKHWTFKIKKPSKGNNLFVNLMTAPQEFQYLGYITHNQYKTSAKSCRTTGAEEHQVIRYLFAYIQRKRLHPDFEVYHEGRCGRCGRPLTDPESIKRGLGPTCAGRS